MPGSEQPDGEDRGSVLILALAFLLVTTLVLTSLTSLAIGGLAATVNLNTQTTLEYAAEGAMEVAVQAVRYAPSWYGSTASCLPGGAASLAVTAAAPAMEVFCSGTQNSESSATRTVHFVACEAGVTTTACEASPLAVADVAFDDFSSANQDQCTTSPLVMTSCGTIADIEDWVIQTAQS